MFTLVELEKVILPKKWAFWEGYDFQIKEKSEVKSKDDWKKTLKKIYEFEDIITFWQHYNNSPFSKFSEIFNNGQRIRFYTESKVRINSIYFFC